MGATTSPALLYLVSGILFILALRGLSSPATSRQGNRFGIDRHDASRSSPRSGVPAAGRRHLAWLMVDRRPSAIGGAIGAWKARSRAR